MKKSILLITLYICSSIYGVQIFAQAAGNYSNRSASNDNYNESANGYMDVNTRKSGVTNPNLEPSFPFGTNIMEFKATALYNAKADAYTAIFNVVQLGETAQESDDRMNARLSSFINALVQAGVKREDIFVDMITFLPIYEYKEGEKRLFSSKTFSEVPAGFELQKNIHIKFAEGSTLDRVV